MATRKASCCICGKEKGGVRCEGCLRIFCLSDFPKHREDLTNQLDAVGVKRDLFRQALTDTQVELLEQHTYMKEISRWENDSIKKIRQVAADTRQTLSQHLLEHCTILDDKLHKLTDKIKQSQEENDFFEMDLDYWNRELDELKEQLLNVPNIVIQKDNAPFIAKISVMTPVEQSNNTRRNTKHDATQMTNAENYFTTCPFCEEPLTSFSKRDHVLICGRKTDECPKCRRFVSRAVFARHCANDCANLDEC
ncbi:unnamed protein product [Adineta ricciae]|nr:unnamed protein product [Adineta ricciae]